MVLIDARRGGNAVVKSDSIDLKQVPHGKHDSFLLENYAFPAAARVLVANKTLGPGALRGGKMQVLADEPLKSLPLDVTVDAPIANEGWDPADGSTLSRSRASWTVVLNWLTLQARLKSYVVSLFDPTVPLFVVASAWDKSGNPPRVLLFPATKDMGPMFAFKTKPAAQHSFGNGGIVVWSPQHIVGDLTVGVHLFKIKDVDRAIGQFLQNNSATIGELSAAAASAVLAAGGMAAAGAAAAPTVSKTVDAVTTTIGSRLATTPDQMVSLMSLSIYDGHEPVGDLTISDGGSPPLASVGLTTLQR